MLTPEEYQNIHSLETSHWWYRSLHQLTLDSIRLHYQTTEVSILDAGCGTGGLLQFLRTKGFTNVKGFDLSPIAVSLCRSKQLETVQGDLRDLKSIFPSALFDIIICHDTLYFFDESEWPDIAGALHARIKPGGLLIANLPALRAFRGKHDHYVGIKKRFNANLIPQLLSPEQFRIIRKVFWPFTLSPLIWISRVIQPVTRILSGKPEAASDLKKENSILNFLLWRITAAENKWMSKKPFGSSLFIVAKRINQL